MKGKIIFTCENYEKEERPIFPAVLAQGVKQLNVSEETVNNYCKFGVAITPSSCYELSLLEPEKRTKLLKQIYSKDGLGLSTGRICIASSDYSPEIYSYDDVAFDTELKHFSIERDEQYVIPMIKEILEINPDLYLYASPWSPPYWMKTGESMCGGYMRDKYLDCYADYIIKFINAYAKHGIKISAVTPQNEPETQQLGNMPACIWHPETEAKFIKILKKKFIENNLNVEVWMLDHSFGYVNRVQWLLDNCEDLEKYCNGAAFHYYDGSIEQTKVLIEKYPNLHLHFTEGGPRLNDHYDTDWCKWGIMILKALQTGYKSFTGWNLMLDELGGPNVGPFMKTCGGLVTNNHQTDELKYSGQYKAFSHIVPFIKPNSKIYSISGDKKFAMVISSYPNRLQNVEGIVIDNQDGKLITILVNPNNQNLQTQISLGGKLWYIELQADSISTVTIEV